MKKVLNFLCNLDLIIACIAATILITITFVGVWFRYLLRNPIQFQEEVQVWCFLYVIFFGGSYVFRTSGHIGIDIIVDSFHGKLREVFEIFGTVVAVIVLVYAFTKGCSLVEQLFRTNRISNILRLPYGIFYICEPIGCILMIINAVAVCYRDHIMVLLGKKEQQQSIRDIAIANNEEGGVINE